MPIAKQVGEMMEKLHAKKQEKKEKLFVIKLDGKDADLLPAVLRARENLLTEDGTWPDLVKEIRSMRALIEDQLRKQGK